MRPTSKFICPKCKEEIYVDNLYDVVREPFRGIDYCSFRCNNCKAKLTVSSEELENSRIDY